MTKIKDIKTSIYKWTGEIVPPAQNFCTNPTDALRESGDCLLYTSDAADE